MYTHSQTIYPAWIKLPASFFCRRLVLQPIILIGSTLPDYYGCPNAPHGPTVERYSLLLYQVGVLHSFARILCGSRTTTTVTPSPQGGALPRCGRKTIHEQTLHAVVAHHSSRRTVPNEEVADTSFSLLRTLHSTYLLYIYYIHCCYSIGYPKNACVETLNNVALTRRTQID